jgi:hypothetical protein
MSDTNEQDEDEDGEFTSRIGPLDIDWPRSLGYFGGIGLALAFDLIAPPIAIFVAVVPFLKLLKRPGANLVERAVAATLEGVAKPVGGDSDATIRLAKTDDEKKRKEEEAKHESKAAAPSSKPSAASVN